MRDAKEFLQLADDGCPHVEVPTAEEIAADIPHFVNGCGPKTYCLFVPFTPTVLRHMIGKDYCVSIEPFNMNGKDGSMVETMCQSDIVALWKRFYPQESQPENDDGEEERTNP